MENPSEKKRFPWGWAAVGCGLVGLVVLAVAVVGVVVFALLPTARTVMANQNPVINPQTAPVIVPTLPPSGQTAPSTAPTAIPPANNGGSTTTDGSLPFQFSPVQDPTTLPSQSLVDQMVSSLNLNNDTDFMAPKTYNGNATLDPTSSFTVGNGWCASDPSTLQQNLSKMKYELTINGTAIDLSKYPTLTFTDQQGHACAMTGIAITPNGKEGGNYHVVLTQKFLSQLDDGITSSPYPAGDVTFDFNIRFSTNPNSGNNT